MKQFDKKYKKSYYYQRSLKNRTLKKGGEKTMRRDAWKYWYPRREHEVGKDTPVLRKLFTENKVSRILDVGCGIGRHIIYFAERGFKVHGFDFSNYAVKRVRDKLKRGRLKANVRVWDARKKFPYRDEFFDVVLVIRVIHHYTTDVIEKIVKEIERITRKGGYLYIQVPTLKRVLKYAKIAESEGSPQIVLEKGTCVPTDGSEKDVPHHGFTRNELKNVFRNFRIKSITVKDEHYNLLGVKK